MDSSGRTVVPVMRVDRSLVRESALMLRELSGNGTEAVLLWAGERQEAHARVRRIVVPEFTSTWRHFEVSLEERIALASALAAKGEIVLAQLHTHPGPAFHSRADDRLALPRHTGAVSIVVPDFAVDWDGGLGDVSVNVHRGAGVWRELASSEVSSVIEVT